MKKRYIAKAVLGTLLFTCSFFSQNVEASSEAQNDVVEIPPRPFSDASLEKDGFVMDAFDAANAGAEIQFPYFSNKVYKIYSQVGFVTDIVFEKNEKIIYVGGGDTVRWRVDTSNVGDTYENYCHLYIKPLAKGITTDFIINTNKRVYRLLVTSTAYYNPVVKWLYNDVVSSEEIGQEVVQNTVKPSGYAVLNPAEFDFNYKIDDKDEPWAPASVFRTQYKTYITMKPDIINYDLPAVFVIDEDGTRNLVAYRFLNNTFIIDRVFDEAVLVAGKKGKIKITYKGGRK